ncbi:MAG: hypothetical protein Q4D26_06010 [Clostridia bacterium]|nr:hypothetical protein [Clostridia bacterium]
MGKNRARTNFYPLIHAEGAPFHEQKEQQKVSQATLGGKRRRRGFANDAAEMINITGQVRRILIFQVAVSQV